VYFEVEGIGRERNVGCERHGSIFKTDLFHNTSLPVIINDLAMGQSEQRDQWPNQIT
jgi:hypothetical protein